MWRMYVLWISLVSVGTLLAAGGCGRPAVREPAPSSPPAATGEQTPSVPENASAAGGDKAATTEGLKELSAEDRAAAEKQRICPVSGDLLGEMGKPYKITVQGRTVFLCCSGCEAQFRRNPEKYFAKMKK